MLLATSPPSRFGVKGSFGVKDLNGGSALGRTAGLGGRLLVGLEGGRLLGVGSAD